MADKKDIDKKDAGEAAAGPGDIQSPEIATAEIKTVEHLETLYPQLVAEIREEVVRNIERCTVQQMKKNLPELYQRIVMDLQSKSGPNLNVPGFLLEVDDPFAEGTLRTYQSLKQVDGLRLPYVLPYKDKVTKDVLASYITRANGGGDIKRVDAAHEAMKKI